MRLVLCDDNRILCEALAVALERRGHKVLATAITTVRGIAAVAEYQPGACLLDLKFPDPPDGLAAARVIRQRHPGTAVLLLSGLIDPAVRSEAMRIGVAAFLRKDQNIDHISDALEVVASGGVIFDSTLTARPSPRRGWRTQSAYVLTPREKDVVRRMVAGQSTAQMAHEMRVEVSTVRTYVKNVLTKLGVHSRLQAAALVTREHLLGDWPDIPSVLEPDQGRLKALPN
jgi:DNA-binding NarL/FixJ family response regulator